MQVRKLNILLIVVLVAMLSSPVLAQGVPVDIPGTGINFFLYRYEGQTAPYDKINDIWDNLSKVFKNWVADGQDPATLSGEDVQVRGTDIFLKGQYIVTVDEYHAKANKGTPAQIAEKWAENLRLGVDMFVAMNVVKSK